jgi:hypothetical protein
MDRFKGDSLPQVSIRDGMDCMPERSAPGLPAKAIEIPCYASEIMLLATIRYLTTATMFRQ